MVETVGQWNGAIAAFAGELKDRIGNNLVAEIVSFPNFEHLEANGSKKGE